VLIAAVVLLVRRRGGGAAAGRRRGAEPPIVVEYLRAARLYAARGYPRGDAQTPREHAADLSARGAPGARPYAALTELYYGARYAGSPVEIGEARRLGADLREALARAPKP
jgi:hypothetical protein